MLSMKTTRPSEVRARLAELNCQPRKALGQNFLIDANILAIILKIAGLTQQDQVLEVGPGLGVLTAPLAATARRVLAVEKDRRLYAGLLESLGHCDNLELIHADMLKLDLEALLKSGINKVVANLPYSVGSAILVNFLRSSLPPARLLLTLQLEVARRLVAQPGQKEFGLLSLWSQLSYQVSIQKTISPTCFYPPPNVRSAIVLLDRRAPLLAAPAARQLFFALTKLAFSQRRKQLRAVFRDNQLPEGLSLKLIKAAWQDLNLDPCRRPESLTLAEWLVLAQDLAQRA